MRAGVKITPREKRRHAELIFLSPRRVSPFLAWGDFHARSRFARSIIPEEKWGTTRSLWSDVKWVMLVVKCRNSVTRLWFAVISDK